MFSGIEKKSEIRSNAYQNSNYKMDSAYRGQNFSPDFKSRRTIADGAMATQSVIRDINQDTQFFAMQGKSFFHINPQCLTSILSNNKGLKNSEIKGIPVELKDLQKMIEDYSRQYQRRGLEANRAIQSQCCYQQDPLRNSLRKYFAQSKQDIFLIVQQQVHKWQQKFRHQLSNRVTIKKNVQRLNAHTEQMMENIAEEEALCNESAICTDSFSSDSNSTVKELLKKIYRETDNLGEYSSYSQVLQISIQNEIMQSEEILKLINSRLAWLEQEYSKLKQQNESLKRMIKELQQPSQQSSY